MLRHRKPIVAFPERAVHRFRVRYAKTGSTAFLGHLDLSRVLARMFRRADVEVAYSRGFHPHPELSFAPALSLGIPALAELFDVKVETPIDARELGQRLHETSPSDLLVTGVWELPEGAPKLARLIKSYDLAVLPLEGQAQAAGLESLAAGFLAKESAIVQRKERSVDVRALVIAADVVSGAAAARVIEALSWPTSPAFLRVRVDAGGDGSAKPVEVAAALGLLSDPARRGEGPHLCRLGFAGVIPEDDGAAATVAAQLL
jgi:radical SAM-linked protein